MLASGCVGELSGAGTPPSVECPGGCLEQAAPTTRFARLTHDQWERTVTDLLYLEEAPGLSATFPPDAPRSTFTDGAELSVSADLRLEYQRAAEALAERVTSDPEALSRIVPTELPASDAEAARAFIESFGRRAHRRPLTTAMVDACASLFAEAPEHYPELDPFVGGVRLVLEAMLQSPYFVYRTELTTTPASEGDAPGLALDDYELASRLSYALWRTMPDDELFEAAATGDLDDPTTLEAHVDRLLEDPRATTTLVAFHEQLFETRSYGDLSRSTTLFPEFDESVPPAMIAEVQTFVRHVVDHDLGFRELITANYTYANVSLARIYGVDGPSGETLERIEWPEGQRAGILTMAGFLTKNASSTDSDPIHRGVFINRRILCQHIDSAPNTPIPSDEPDMPRTLRQRIDAHTGPGTCGATCHGELINPIGFAFEHYDALGRYRDTETNGLAIDAAAEYAFRSGTHGYDGAVELADRLAEERAAHRCYASHLLEFVEGHNRASEDEALIRRLAGDSAVRDASLRAMVRSLVTSAAFRQRAATELDTLPAVTE